MRELPARTTRGRRLRALLEDEEDADEEFWAQEFFQEEAKDVEYDAVGEVDEDEFDSDFADTTEDEVEDERSGSEDDLEAETTRKKKKSRPGSGPEKKQASQRRTEAELQAARWKREELKRKREQELGHRKSVRSAVVEKDLVRQEQQDKKAVGARKPTQKTSKPTVEDKPLRQEDLIREAVLTELENRRKLQHLLTREEETKKKAHVQKVRFKGPSVKLHSKGDKTTISFTHTDRVPSILRQKEAPSKPAPALCAVTGQPARYKDPWTGKPYATTDAYRTLRSSSHHYMHRGRQRDIKSRGDAQRRTEDILFPPGGLKKGRRTRSTCNRATLHSLIRENQVQAPLPTR